MHPDQGLNPQPRCVHWQGMEPTAFFGVSSATSKLTFLCHWPLHLSSCAAYILTIEKHAPLLSSFSLVYLEPVVLSWGLRGISSKYPYSHEMFPHLPSTILDIFSSLPDRNMLWPCSFLLVKWQLVSLMVPSDPLPPLFLRTNSSPQLTSGLMTS